MVLYDVAENSCYIVSASMVACGTMWPRLVATVTRFGANFEGLKTEYGIETSCNLPCDADIDRPTGDACTLKEKVDRFAPTDDNGLAIGVTCLLDRNSCLAAACDSISSAT